MIHFSLHLVYDTGMGNIGRKPTVLIPYGGRCTSNRCHDVFVYLRPETNGVEVESTLFRVVKTNPEYKGSVKLVYLANIPGDFIMKNRIVEEYYASQLYFISRGKDGFTPHMRNIFGTYFHEPVEDADIISPFEALKRFGMDYNELFNLRVPLSQMLIVNGQTIKCFKGCYILNYDIPAILHKNNNKTDIAAMIFRTRLEYNKIHNLIDDMGDALKDADILHSEKPLSRIFHYSKGPFAQIRDALGHLYTPENDHVPVEELTFCSFLMENGFSTREIIGAIRNPVVRIRTKSGKVAENYLFALTANETFEGALDKFSRIDSQVITRQGPVMRLQY